MNLPIRVACYIRELDELPNKAANTLLYYYIKHPPDGGDCHCLTSTA